ncbi:MAG: hypothetical protein WDN31_06300 [Hyphomicrobium sp.]
MLERARAEALLADRNMDLKALAGIDPILVSQHAQVHQSRLQQRAKEREVLLTRVAQKKAEIAGLETQIPMQARLVEMQKERLEGRQKLFSEGSMSKKQVLEVETLYEQARIQVRESERKLAMAREALPEADAALLEADAQARKVWSEELAKSSSELAEVQESMRKQADRVDRLVVRAPIRGRVQNLLQRSPGEVVPPGESILRVVPVGGDLVAEVRAKPGGHRRHKGGRQGRDQGQCLRLHPFRQAQGRGRLHLGYDLRDRRAPAFLQGRGSASIRSTSHRFRACQAGMTVDADIISGSKSLLRYVLKPVFRGFDTAFSER